MQIKRKKGENRKQERNRKGGWRIIIWNREQQKFRKVLKEKKTK